MSVTDAFDIFPQLQFNKHIYSTKKGNAHVGVKHLRLFVSINDEPLNSQQCFRTPKENIENGQQLVACGGNSEKMDKNLANAIRNNSFAISASLIHAQYHCSRSHK